MKQIASKYNFGSHIQFLNLTYLMLFYFIFYLLCHRRAFMVNAEKTNVALLTKFVAESQLLGYSKAEVSIQAFHSSNSAVVKRDAALLVYRLNIDARWLQARPLQFVTL